MGSNRLKSLGAVVLLLGMITLFFHEAIFRGHSLVPTDLLHHLVLPYRYGHDKIEVQNHYAMDALVQDYPWGLFWQESMRRGELPLWNPSILGGQPHLATSMAGVLNPLRVLYLFCSGERAMSWGIILAFAIAAVGMFALLREVGRSRVAALLGAAAFALNSAFLNWYWRQPGVFAWMPLAFLLYERAERRQSAGLTGLAGLVVAVAMVSGNVQAAAHVMILTVGYVAARLWQTEPDARLPTVRRAGLLVAVAVTASAIQWLPTLELMTLDASGRVQTAGPKPSLLHTLSAIPMLVHFVFPGLTGSTETYDVLKLFNASRGGVEGYIGLVPATLFLFGAFAGRDRRSRGLLILCAAVLFIVFLTPLVKYLYHRLLVVISFVTPFIAAQGLDAMLEDNDHPRAQAGRAFTLMLVVCAAVAAFLFAAELTAHWKGERLRQLATDYVLQRAHESPFRSETAWLRARAHSFVAHYRLSNRVFWVPLAGMLMAGVAWHRYRRGTLARPLFAGVLVGVAMLDLVVTGRILVPQVDLQRFPLPPPHPLLETMRNEPGLFRVYRTGPTHWWLFRPNLLMTYRLDDLWGYESLMPAHLDTLPNGRDTTPNRLLDLQGVRFVFTDAHSLLPADHFTLIAEQDGVRLYRNNQALPRVQFFTRWEVISDRATLLNKLTSPAHPVADVVLLEKSPPLGSASPEPARASVEVVEYRPHTVHLRVQTAQPGLVVLSDTYYPGWQVQVDGHLTEILRANQVMRAVAVSPGNHEIVFRYQPLSVLVGALFSLLAVGLVAGIGWRTRSLQRGSTPILPATDTASTNPQSPAS